MRPDCGQWQCPRLSVHSGYPFFLQPFYRLIIPPREFSKAFPTLLTGMPFLSNAILSGPACSSRVKKCTKRFAESDPAFACRTHWEIVALIQERPVFHHLQRPCDKFPLKLRPPANFQKDFLHNCN